jgi:hypothetical protein
MAGTTIAKRAEVALRRQQAIEMRNNDAEWKEIAEALGYADAGAACKDVSRALDAYVRQQGLAIEHLRARELASLDALAEKAVEIMQGRHPLVSHGRIVKEEDDFGNEVTLLDPAPALGAMDRLLRIAERRAKLLGLDMPVKVDLTATSVEYNFVGINIQAVQ